MKYFAYQVVGGNTCSGKAANSVTCKVATPTTNPIYHALIVTADILAVIAGIIAVIMIIISGLTMITSRGNSEAVNSARNRIIYSVVGLIIIALAWTITSLVVKRLTG